MQFRLGNVDAFQLADGRGAKRGRAPKGRFSPDGYGWMLVAAVFLGKSSCEGGLCGFHLAWEFDLDFQTHDTTNLQASLQGIRVGFDTESTNICPVRCTKSTQSDRSDRRGADRALRSAVHLRPRGTVDGYVPLQVPLDATGAHVQGLEASHLLPLLGN